MFSDNRERELAQPRRSSPLLYASEHASYTALRGGEAKPRRVSAQLPQVVGDPARAPSRSAARDASSAPGRCRSVRRRGGGQRRAAASEICDPASPGPGTDSFRVVCASRSVLRRQLEVSSFQRQRVPGTEQACGLAASLLEFNSSILANSYSTRHFFLRVVLDSTRLDPAQRRTYSQDG